MTSEKLHPARPRKVPLAEFVELARNKGWHPVLADPKQQELFLLQGMEETRVVLTFAEDRSYLCECTIQVARGLFDQFSS